MKFPQFFSASDERKYGRPIRALIDLTAFTSNIKSVQGLVANSKLIVVVKANAYGHGLLELAQVVDTSDLAVAIPEELNQLRSAGIKNRIWVLEGFFSRNCILHTKSVIWLVHSFWQLELLKEMSEENLLETIDVCIKLDTGMHRLGFNEADLVLVNQYIKQMPKVRPYALMTHFSTSDHVGSSQVLSQIKHFDDIRSKYNLQTLKQSLANSGAVCFYPESYRDYVRPGIMLYGASPAVNTQLPVSLKPVMSLQSAVIAIHHIKQGESVGYGGTWIADRDTIVATVAVGYADGYPRHAPNGTPVAIISSNDANAKIVQLIGRVSMDMITVDVTDADDVEVGQQVELWGKHISIDKVAKLSGTISYELLTSVSSRVPRVYINS